LWYRRKTNLRRGIQKGIGAGESKHKEDICGEDNIKVDLRELFIRF
jgi:hypothetical protein